MDAGAEFGYADQRAARAHSVQDGGGTGRERHDTQIVRRGQFLLSHGYSNPSKPGLCVSIADMSLALLLFALHPPFAAQSSQMDPQKLETLVERSVKIHRAWGAQMNGAAVSADVKEIYRRPGNGQTIVAYHVFVHGL